MASSAVTFLLIIVAAAWTSSLTSLSLTDAAPSPSKSFVPPPPCAPPQSAVVFLRERCSTTLYGVACYQSLLPYACIFHTSHVKLARAAGDVNVAWLRSISKRVKEIVARGAGGGAESAALRDCASTVSSAAGLAKQSAAELAKLDAAGDTAGIRQVRWAISNAQTWLSASMTNEATCADGLAATGAVATSPVAREVEMVLVRAKELTSIALALVHGIPVPHARR